MLSRSKKVFSFLCAFRKSFDSLYSPTSPFLGIINKFKSVIKILGMLFISQSQIFIKKSSLIAVYAHMGNAKNVKFIWQLVALRRQYGSNPYSLSREELQILKNFEITEAVSDAPSDT